VHLVVPSDVAGIPLRVGHISNITTIVQALRIFFSFLRAWGDLVRVERPHNICGLCLLDHLIQQRSSESTG
jgi:hypothetical protein